MNTAEIKRVIANRIIVQRDAEGMLSGFVYVSLPSYPALISLRLPREEARELAAALLEVAADPEPPGGAA